MSVEARVSPPPRRRCRDRARLSLPLRFRRQDVALRIDRQIDRLLGDHVGRRLQQRNAPGIFRRILVERAISLHPLIAKLHGEQLRDALAIRRLLPGREAQSRIEDAAGIVFRIAGGVGPAIKHDARQLGGVVELEIFRDGDLFDLHVDADLAPHRGNRLRHLVVVRERAVGGARTSSAAAWPC